MRRLVLRLTIAAMVSVMLVAGSAAPAAAWGFRDCDRDDPCRNGFVTRDFDRDDFLAFNRFDRDDCDWVLSPVWGWVLVCDF